MTSLSIAVTRIKKWGFDYLTSNTEKDAIKKALAPIPRSANVLDVGCGYGDKIKYLQKLGFSSFTGIEKNPVTAEAVRKSGIPVVLVEDVEDLVEKNSFDVLVFSHIIEHFSYVELKKVIEFYLQYIKVGGKILIVTPTLGNSFYNDFDHVKPYNVQAINSVFVNENTQVQFGSACRMKLLDFYYRKSPRLVFFPYRAHILGRRNPFIDVLNLTIILVFKITYGVLGKVTGWVATYEYLGTTE